MRTEKHPKPTRQNRQARPTRSWPDQTLLDPALALQRALAGPEAALSPADVLVLQRSLGNRTVEGLLAGRGRPRLTGQGRLLQRYAVINPADYTLQAGAEFVSQDIEEQAGVKAYTKQTIKREGDGGITRKKERKGAAGYETVHEGPGAAPNLKYSAAGDKAIALEATTAEPKVFYATDAVKAESNNKLEKNLADFRIEEAGGSIQVPRDMADPTGAKHTLKLMKPAEPRREAGTGLYRILANQVGEISECNSFVKYILSDVYQARTAVFQGEHEAPVTEEHEPVREVAEFAAAGHGDGAALAAHLRGTPSGEHTQYLPAAYTGMANKAARHQALGINEAARPEVGEGYVTMSNQPDPDDLTYAQYQTALTQLNDMTIPDATKAHNVLRHAWGYHYAGVVAKVNDDTITLENYNRNTKMVFELDELYNRLFANTLRFRQFVQEILETHKAEEEQGRIPAIPSQRQAWWKMVAARWQTHIQTASAEYQAAHQAITDALAQIKKSEQEGMAVGYTGLYHFKMYGTGAGQSFHEQWQSALTDPITLRIRESVEVAKQIDIAKMRRKIDDIDRASFIVGGLCATARHRLGQLQAATDLKELSTARYDLNQFLNTGIEYAINQTARQAARIAGKTKATIPAYDGTNLQQITALIDKWTGQGWAVSKSAKQKKAQRRSRLQNLRLSITELHRIRGAAY